MSWRERAPPQVVNLARKYSGGKRCAAIGDGGNDVSMILAADVGLGIVGKVRMHLSISIRRLHVNGHFADASFVFFESENSTKVSESRSPTSNSRVHFYTYPYTTAHSRPY